MKQHQVVSKMSVSNPINIDVRSIIELIRQGKISASVTDDGKQISLKKTPREAKKPQTSPPTGLECFEYLYDSYGDVDTNQVISQSYAVLLEDKRVSQGLSVAERTNESLGVTTECTPSTDTEKIMKISLLERVRLIEEEDELAPDICQKLKNLLICFKQIYHGQIPDEFALGSSIFTLLNLKCDDGPDVGYWYISGGKNTSSFYVTMRYVLKNYQGLHQVFSKKFALELLNCFSDFPNKYLELASGKAMLSAAFKAVGPKGIIATDEVVPKTTFADFKVTKCNANKLLKSYRDDKPIYFISEPTGLLMEELCETALNEKEPLMIVTIGSLFKETLQKHTKDLFVIELTIPDYVELNLNEGVQLLLFNHSAEQISVCREKLPSRYLQFHPGCRHQPDKKP